MDAVVFEDWWNEYLRKHRDDRDSGEYAIRELRWYLRNLPAAKRPAFIAELLALVRDNAPGSDRVLEVFGTEASVAEVRALWDAAPVDPRHPLLAHHIAILRVMAKRDSRGPAANVLRQVIRETPMGVWWTGLPWALWPHEPDLFAEAWVRFFKSEPASRWSSTSIPQAFHSKAEALRVVRGPLQQQSPKAWEDLHAALAAQHHAPWLSASEQQALMHELS